MAGAANKNIGLTIYLLKPDQVQTFEHAVVDAAEEVVLVNEPLNGVFLPVSREGKEPQWVEAVQAALQAPIAADMDGTAPAGLLVIWHLTRTFVVTFGHAWQRLDVEWLERDFGRRVALNSIPRDSVKWIKSEQFLAKWHIASEKAPRASKVDEFGVDFQRDLVAAVEGIPTLQPSLGASVRGGTSIRLNLPIGDLSQTLDTCSLLFDSNAYKTDWPEIDNISPVRDVAVAGVLDGLLDVAISTGVAKQQLSMFTPSEKKGEEVNADAYQFGKYSQSAVTIPYLTYDLWENYLVTKNLTPSVAHSKHIRVHVLDEHGQDATSFRVFDCFGYEAGHNGKIYILSSGMWYEVLGNFITEINGVVTGIDPTPVPLPAWNQTADEAQYNVGVAAGGSFINCDRKILHYGGGQSKFEFCDLVHLQSKTLFFVKKASKSSGMSHLFEQVRRTVELLFGVDQSYRDKVKALFTTHNPNADATWLDARLPHGTWTLCMVSLGESAIKLPFFARMGLAKIYKQLRGQGHSVAFTSV